MKRKSIITVNNKKPVWRLILIISLFLITVITGFKILYVQPPKLKNIETIRIEYNPKLMKTLSLTSPLEINNPEQIRQLVDCFNVKSEYGIGCDCPSNDILIHFIAKEKEYTYHIGITGDPRIQYVQVPDKDIFGIDIDNVIICLKNQGSENLNYPYE